MFQTQTDSTDSFKRRFNKYLKTIHRQTIVVCTQFDALKMRFQLFENVVQIISAQMITPHLIFGGIPNHVFELQAVLLWVYFGYPKQICDYTA